MRFCNICHRVYQTKVKKCRNCRNTFLIDVVEATAKFSSIKNRWVLELLGEWGKRK